MLPSLQVFIRLNTQYVPGVDGASCLRTLQDQFVTMAEYFSSNGYDTAAVVSNRGILGAMDEYASGVSGIQFRKRDRLHPRHLPFQTAYAVVLFFD